MKHIENDDLERLRQLLLGTDELNVEELRAEIDTLREQVEDEESMIAHLDPVIADLLERKINSSRQDMAEALAPVMGPAIQNQISDAKEDVVDALYPVIGESIRKSISEAMKDLVNSVNRRIERELLQRILPRRLYAKLVGVSPAEWVVSDSVPFHLDHLFMIHKETGLLISHVSSDRSGNSVDQELVSGMLTAIRDFVADAFQENPDKELSEIQYGNSRILIEVGRYFYLAAVVSGVNPPEFRDDLARLSRRLHNRYYSELRVFDGDLSSLHQAGEVLGHFIDHYDYQISYRKSRRPARPYLRYFGLGLLLALVVWLAVSWVPGQMRDRDIQERVRSVLASHPAVQQEKVTAHVDDRTVYLAGEVSSAHSLAQLDSLLHRLSPVPDIENRVQVVWTSATEARILEHIENRIAGYDSMTYFRPRFILDRDHVSIQGFVPNLRIKRELGYLVSEVPGVKIVENNAGVLNETEIADARIYLHELTLFFEDNVDTLDSRQLTILGHVVNFVKGLPHKDVRLVVRGFSDDNAGYYTDLRMSKRRARRVADELVKRSMRKEQIIVLYYGDKYPLVDDPVYPDQSLRNSRVEFDIIVGEETVGTIDRDQ
jgi:outer membrane protein OmpA-like peptidoglycan-associated protein